MEDKQIRQIKAIAAEIKKQIETDHRRLSFTKNPAQEDKENNHIAILNVQNRAC
jgi:hypothetical protein